MDSSKPVPRMSQSQAVFSSWKGNSMKIKYTMNAREQFLQEKKAERERRQKDEESRKYGRKIYALLKGSVVRRRVGEECGTRLQKRVSDLKMVEQKVKKQMVIPNKALIQLLRDWVMSKRLLKKGMGTESEYLFGLVDTSLSQESGQMNIAQHPSGRYLLERVIASEMAEYKSQAQLMHSQLGTHFLSTLEKYFSPECLLAFMGAHIAHFATLVHELIQYKPNLIQPAQLYYRQFQYYTKLLLKPLESKEKGQFNALMQYQSSLCLHLLSIPHIVHYVALSHQQIKSVYQSFIFSHLQNPLQNDAHIHFKAKYPSLHQPMLLIAANSLTILHHTNHSIDNHYALLKTILFGIHYLTHSTLTDIYNNPSLTHSIQYLKQAFSLLYNPQFALHLLSNHSNYIVFYIISQIYCLFIILSQQNKYTQHLSIKVISGLAFNKSIQEQLYGYVCSYPLEEVIPMYFLFALNQYNQLQIEEEYKERYKIKIDELVQLLYRKRSRSGEDVILNGFLEQVTKLLKLIIDLDRTQARLLDSAALQLLGHEFAKWKFSNIQVCYQMPFAFPLEFKIHLLQCLIAHQQSVTPHAYQINLTRDNFFQEGFQAFMQLSQLNLKAKLIIHYQDEVGLDAGGIFKEFLIDLANKVFDPNFGMFICDQEQQQLYPNPHSGQVLGDDQHLDIFFFVGTVIGRAIYNGIQIQALFSPIFLRKILMKETQFSQLKSFDPTLHKNLNYIKHYQADLKDLALNFTWNNLELIPNGANVDVDHTNVMKYIYLVADHTLNKQIHSQTQAFLNGLNQVIPLQQLQLFDETELQLLISGSQQGINIQDLQDNTNYKNGYTKKDRYILQFWKMLHEMSEQQKQAFLKFVTSCQRVPILGFKSLQPQFTIQKVDSLNDTILPTSSTCFNLFYLPSYSSQNILKQKLQVALCNSQGFHLV